uniref:ribosomal protein S11 n=1 Tax=Palisada intermedia TaxID=397057 RepID=UPI00286BEACE|nr:ribosomal protein S11 [Palisada intermedia]WMC20778.1 ribosomal protein S11 [Palisada intermedia]
MKKLKIYFLFILFSSNNIFITITNSNGKVLLWKSLGYLKVKGLKKLTPSILKNLFHLFDKVDLKLHIKLKGFNKLKKFLVKDLILLPNINILSLIDDSLQSNNGCKLKNYRRL